MLESGIFFSEFEDGSNHSLSGMTAEAVLVDDDDADADAVVRVICSPVSVFAEPGAEFAVTDCASLGITNEHGSRSYRLITRFCQSNEVVKWKCSSIFATE